MDETIGLWIKLLLVLHRKFICKIYLLDVVKNSLKLVEAYEMLMVVEAVVYILLDLEVLMEPILDLIALVLHLDGGLSRCNVSDLFDLSNIGIISELY